MLHSCRGVCKYGLNLLNNIDSFPEAWQKKPIDLTPGGIKKEGADIAFWVGKLTHCNTKNKCQHDKGVRSISQQLVRVLFNPAIIIMLLTDYHWNVLAKPNTDRLDATANYICEINCWRLSFEVFKVWVRVMGRTSLRFTVIVHASPEDGQIMFYFNSFW